MLGVPEPGAVTFLFLVVSSPASSPTGLLVPVAPVAPVAGLGLFVLLLALALVLALLLALVLGIGLVLVVVHLVESRALLAPGVSLLLPLVGTRPTVGSHCLAF